MKRTVKPQGEGDDNPQGDRRYPAGKYPTYDSTYDQRLKRSAIINPDARRHDSNMAFSMADLTGLKSILNQLQGETGKDDMHFFRGDWHKALIPMAEKKISSLQSQFNKYAQDQIKQGFSIEMPEEWPADMLKEKLVAEAVLDAYKMERSIVHKKIQELEAKDAEKIRSQDAQALLRYGPICKGFNPDSGEPKIDGQKVEFTESGIPFISDSRSPYKGMALADYRRMSKAWVARFQTRSKERTAELEKSAKGIAVPLQEWRPRAIFRKRKLRPDELPEPLKDSLKIDIETK